MFFQRRQTLCWWSVRPTSSCLGVGCSLIDVPITIPAFSTMRMYLYSKLSPTACDASSQGQKRSLAFIRRTLKDTCFMVLQAFLRRSQLPNPKHYLPPPFSRCENCVDMLFVRGSGNCVQCDTPLRKSNFRVQLFEDPTIDKEVEIRKKVLMMWVAEGVGGGGGGEGGRGWLGRWGRGCVSKSWGAALCVYVSSRCSSHFLNHHCLSHYVVCFVDNKSPLGWVLVVGGWGVLWREALFSARFLLFSPSLPSPSLFLSACLHPPFIHTHTLQSAL